MAAVLALRLEHHARMMPTQHCRLRPHLPALGMDDPRPGQRPLLTQSSRPQLRVPRTSTRRVVERKIDAPTVAKRTWTSDVSCILLRDMDRIRWNEIAESPESVLALFLKCIHQPRVIAEVIEGVLLGPSGPRPQGLPWDSARCWVSVSVSTESLVINPGNSNSSTPLSEFILTLSAGVGDTVVGWILLPPPLYYSFVLLANVLFLLYTIRWGYVQAVSPTTTSTMTMTLTRLSVRSASYEPDPLCMYNSGDDDDDDFQIGPHHRRPRHLW
ncbi:hypothetical protein R3P38DRAFT_2780337 [Favolaschia claudopus]|uniref:Uncharacterized protein n=1 Tax=Favolaschia claudopus TaxID=2862362 RepID=A0AAW0B7W1_9AGAR